MRVLIFTEASGLYGAERWTASIANGLARRGVDVTLARPRGAEVERVMLQSAVALREFNIVSHDEPFRWITDRTLASEILDAERPDAVIVSNGSVVACVGVREELLARNIPYISVAHLGGQAGFDLPCPDALRERVAAVLNGAAACVGVSQDVVDSLRADFGLAPDRGIAILNGRPDEFFTAVDSARRREVRRALGLDDDSVMLLTTARVHPNKGYQYQLAAMELLRTRPVWPRLRFVWAGGTEAQRRLQALVSARNLGDSVQLLGHREDIVDLLGAADLFVLPSRQEAAPLAIVEAMAMGVATITTPVNGIPDLVGDCAVMIADPNVDPNATARELAAQIESLAADAERRATLGRAAHERASRLWQEDTMIDTYQALLEGCVA